MSNTPSLALAARTARFEVVEERLVLSAQPLPTLAQHVELVAPVETPIAMEGGLVHHLDEVGADGGAPGVTQHLNTAHAGTGVDDVRADYGFTGAGQTVVVIDSGIAYDHEALGGGFGPGHRVVGGWDFAENDADPFDDAPAGFHGTHVAGIIGSDDATYSGVAPGVDLVALRVFDDFGNGDFDWVEDALQWVLANKDSFANPITTVNMSIGAPHLNNGGVPGWAMLEDELQALYNAGIFVSVSAGNDFQEFGTQGLSYPAVSPWVVPVASGNDAGTAMSSFSQRAGHVLVAPGESIISTVPDELFSFDGIANDWAYASGTSMASPYVAGASVLVRQAYDFMGIENVDQGMIYDALFDTATLIYDPITAVSYHFIDVEAALGSIIPDMFADSSAAATDVGMLSDADSFAETIGKLNDRDYFTFTAGQTGLMTLSADASQQMIAQWELIGGGGTLDGNSLSFNVVSGQTYTVGLMSSGGMGHYTVNATIESNAIEWGIVERTHVDDVVVDGEAWYSITTTRAGLVTVEADYAGGENVDIEIYDVAEQLLAGGTNSAGHTRSDVTAAAGQTLLVRVSGTAAAADFSLWNVVGINGSTATVFGTSGDDAFNFAAGANHAVSVNGLAYTLNAATFANVTFEAGAGNDQIDMTGGSGDDLAVLSISNSTLTGAGYAVAAHDVEVVRAYGGGGALDRAMLYDGAGDDVLTSSPTQTQFSGTGFNFTATGFDDVRGFATAGGNDTAHLTGSNGNDLFKATATYAYMEGGSYFNVAKGFEQVFATAGAGSKDRAKLYDGAGDDVLTSGPTQTQLSGTGYQYTVTGFDDVRGFATAGGNDTAHLAGSDGDDEFKATSTYTYMQGSGFFNVARGFEQVFATAGGGTGDLARLYDGAGNDVFTAGPTQAQFSGAGFDFTVTGFDQVNAYSTKGGVDVGHLAGSDGDDLYYGTPGYAYLSGAGFFNVARGFKHVFGDAGGGDADTARLYDSSGNDLLVAGPGQVQFSGASFDHTVTGFDEVKTYATAGGHDTAYVVGGIGDDNLLVGSASFNWLSDSGTVNGQAFEEVHVDFTQDGADSVTLFSVMGQELLWGSGSAMRLDGGSRDIEVEGLDILTAFSANGQTPTSEIDVVDYLFFLLGDWEDAA